MPDAPQQTAINFVEADSLLNSHQPYQQLQALSNTINRIRQPLALDQIFQITATEVRYLLKVDRVAVFRFYPDQDWEGEFIAEACHPQWDSVLTKRVYDHCFGEQFAPYYQQGRIQAVADIHQEGLSDCHITILSKFQVRANLVIPVLQGDTLWGLLCVHQCATSRSWQPSEIEFVKRIAEHFGVAVQQARYIADAQYIAQQQRALTGVSNRIRASLDLQTIFMTTAIAVRQLIAVDRVAILRVRSMSPLVGEFVAEDVAADVESMLAVHLDADVLHEMLTAAQPPYAIRDIHQTTLTAKTAQCLEQSQIKAYLAVPLRHGEQLWGLLCVHQCQGVRSWTESEIEFVTQIAEQLGIALKQDTYINQVQVQATQIAEAAERERLAERQKVIAATADKIRRSLNIDTIFQTSTQAVLSLLGVERVAIYRFNPDWSGCFVAEAVAKGWPPLVGETTMIEDTYLQETQGGRYVNQETFAVHDIYAVGHTDCHIELLQQFYARAYAIAPILVGNRLWGLLAAYQNSGPRHWVPEDVDLLAQLGAQLGIALLQAEALEKWKTQTAELKKAAERQQALTRAIENIRQSLDIDTIFQTTIQEVQALLQVERVAIYRFNPDGSGEFVADSIVDGWSPQRLMQALLAAHLSQPNANGKYPRHETFVPISQGDELWGLLVAYQNSQPRYWQDEEINLLAQVGCQLGVALQQAELLRQTQEQTDQLSTTLQSLQATQTKLVEAANKAEMASQAKSEFLAKMSHELRTPLNIILGFSQLLARETDLSANQKEFIDLINHSGEHLLFLINDVLETAKIEAGQLALNTVSFNLPGLVHAIAEMFTLRAQAKGVPLIVEYTSTLPPCVIGDDAKIRQILINLLSNATKFTQTGQITLRIGVIDETETMPATMAEADAGSVPQAQEGFTLWFEVEDTGSGIASDQLPIVFDPFKQVQSARHGSQGTGLGLFISRQFAQAMGGNLRVRSQVGQGTIFTGWLRLKLGQTDAVSGSQPYRTVVGLSPNQPPLRVLISEDNESSQRLLANLLSSVGFNVRTVEDGQAAINLFLEWHPHCIWMDLHLPNVNGLQATRAIRDLPQGDVVTIFAITASVLDQSVHELQEQGFDGFVGKPFRVQEIFDLMAQHLGICYQYAPENITIDGQNIDAQQSLDASLTIADSNTGNAAQNSDPLAITNLPDVDGVSLEWLSQLGQASLMGLEPAIKELIGQLLPEQNVLAQALQEKVDNFDFEAIEAWVLETLKLKTNPED
jgi:GAF domain-containing protein/CheY-like chemotaxis protein